ncbi:hypothetical protein LCGC14_2775800, partial [marine sediment metagenome]
ATEYRRIGSVLTDGSANIIGFSQFGDEFLWDAPVAEYAAVNPGISAVTVALTVPTGVQVRAIHAQAWDDDSPAGAGDVYILVTSLDQDDTAPSATIFSWALLDGGGAALASSGHFVTRTDTSGQIRYRSTKSDAGIKISGTTQGWMDRRGRNS